MSLGQLNIAPQDLWPWLLIAGGAVALGVILLLITLLLKRRDPAAGRSSHVTPAQQRTLERDVSNLIAALSEMAQEVGTGLDERAVRLEQLIRDADERLERLSHVQGRDPAWIAPPVSIPPSQPSPSRDEPDARHAEIYNLADQGLAVIEIADQLSRPKGEVELILALRPRRAG